MRQFPRIFMDSLVLFTTILLREKVIQVKLNRLRKNYKTMFVHFITEFDFYAILNIKLYNKDKVTLKNTH